MISPVFIAAFGLFILSTSTSTLTQAQPAVLIGVTEEGKRCKAPLECKSPLYCVPKGGANMKTEYTCEKMPCGPLTPCSIGLQCGGDGFCEGVPCSDDKQCLGITVCGAAESRCKPKVSSGNSCVRDAECWSDKCEDEICLSAALEEEKEVAYSRNRNRNGNRNRGADIALGVLGLLSLLTALLLCILCLKGDNMLSKSASDDEDTEDPRVPVPEMKINSPATSIADRLKGGAAGAVGTAKNGAVAVGDSVRNGTTSGLETAKNGAAAAGDAVRSGTTAAVDTSRKLAGAAVDTGRKAASAAADTGRKAANTAAAKAGDAVPDSVKNAAARAGDTAKEGAHRVAEGASDAAEAAKNAAAGAVDAARNAVRR